MRISNPLIPEPFCVPDNSRKYTLSEFFRSTLRLRTNPKCFTPPTAPAEHIGGVKHFGTCRDMLVNLSSAPCQGHQSAHGRFQVRTSGEFAAYSWRETLSGEQGAGRERGHLCDSQCCPADGSGAGVKVWAGKGMKSSIS